MKQKIFSLLVFMITTVCGAWAQDDFKVQLSVNCSALSVENGLFYSTEHFESELKGGILISGFKTDSGKGKLGKESKFFKASFFNFF